MSAHPSPVTSLAPRLVAALAVATALGGCGPGTAPGTGRDGDLAAADSPFADLVGEAPIAPPQPVLDIAPAPGALIFRWNRAPPGTRRVRLFAHDARAGDARELDVPIAADARGLRLPLAAHRVAWRASSWRVERCDAAGCVSSRRTTAAAGAALDTAHEVVPAVAVAGERFGERLAMNADGTLLVVAAPVEGRLAIRHLGVDGPILADPLPRLDGPASTTRALDVAVAADGDTVAALTGDAARGRAPRLVVLERVGEGWIESASLAALPGTDVALGHDGARPHVRVSADGSRLLAACTGAPTCRAVVHERTDSGWRVRAGFGGAPGAGDRPPGTPVAIAASAALGRVAIVSARPGESPELRVHDLAGGPANGTSPVSLRLDTLAPDTPVAIAMDAGGMRLAIAGLEASGVPTPAPTVRRYLVAGGDATRTPALEDVLRLRPPPTPVLALSLAADATLDTLAFGRRTAEEAALTTHVRVDGRWAPALELPGHANALAARPFGATLALDADGSTLAFDVPSAPADPPSALSAGRVLLMRESGAAAALERRPAHPDRASRR